MPTSRVTMSKMRQTLQLRHSGNLSQRQIGSALGISKSTVSEIASYTRAVGLDWKQAQQLSDEELQARLYRPPVARQSRHLEPDFAHHAVHYQRRGAVSREFCLTNLSRHNTSRIIMIMQMSEQKSDKVVLTSLAIAVASIPCYAAYTKWELIGKSKEIYSIKSNEHIFSRKIVEKTKHLAELQNQNAELIELGN